MAAAYWIIGHLSPARLGCRLTLAIVSFALNADLTVSSLSTPMWWSRARRGRVCTGGPSTRPMLVAGSPPDALVVGVKLGANGCGSGLSECFVMARWDPVAATCRVLGSVARQPYYRWLAEPLTAAELDEAYRANALFDALRADPNSVTGSSSTRLPDAGQTMAPRPGVADLFGEQVVGVRSARSAAASTAVPARRPTRISSPGTSPSISGISCGATISPSIASLPSRSGHRADRCVEVLSWHDIKAAVAGGDLEERQGGHHWRSGQDQRDRTHLPAPPALSQARQIDPVEYETFMTTPAPQAA